MPPTTPDTVGMISALVVTRALLAVVDGRPDDAVAPIDAAAEMTDRFGELGAADPLGFGWGPTGVEFRRVRLALEAGDPERAVRIAEDLHPERDVFPVNHVYHWVGYGRALARLRGRQDDAVRALRRAEAIHPHRVQRDPFVREALAHLLPRTRRDSPAGRELRGMAYRAELDV
ncbi:MAG: tetratricopeptide repeat protein [Pseudonocardiaceae bacterium]